MTQIEPDETLDCKNKSCPMPVFLTKKKMDTMAPGHVLEILATDKASIKDIPAWARKNNVEVLEIEEGEEVIKIYVRKGA